MALFFILIKFLILGVINAPDINFEGELANINQRFRKGLDLYANVVKVQSLPGVQSRHSGIDMVIIREQTEGEYAGEYCLMICVLGKESTKLLYL